MWDKIITNPQALRSIYTEVPPPKDLQVSHLSLSYNGPSFILGLQFPIFPDKPSKKWPKTAKSLYANISFGFREINLKRFGTNNLISINSEGKHGDPIWSIVFTGSDFHLEIKSWLGWIDEFRVD